ncbi:hypothetical protein UM399_04850 [Sulfitobacter pontiacus]|uniref:hypothetical protein n=1 Tax=Sulfitobacter pontiacus TaxID=60137 RepID=UPI002AC94021|nr:hypothetical protein [Sulfitobacter pontiacus]WPZ26328.1 hypothetical protein UM399_04850 [Sulfitobacter pontiacus]
MPTDDRVKIKASPMSARTIRSKARSREYANSSSTFEIARKASQEGIAITRSYNSSLADCWRPTGTGRPMVNVFETYMRKQGKIQSFDTISIPVQRRILLDKHENLSKQDKGRPEIKRLMKSYVYEQRGKNDWTVHFAAELAWILMGHNFIERVDCRPIHLRGNARFIDETTALWRFLNEDIERYCLARRGKKPSAEKLFKASLATFVAKKLIRPKGGNSTPLPSMKEVSQVWFVLFGEYESHDKIKKLVARLPDYLNRFQSSQTVLSLFKMTHFRRLVPAIKLKQAK